MGPVVKSPRYMFQGINPALYTCYNTDGSVNYAEMSESYANIDQGLAQVQAGIEVADTAVGFAVGAVPYGTEVYSGSTANLEVDGIFGIRANHSLDLVVEGFGETD